MDVKGRLREVRKFLKLSQEALAIETGSQRTTVAGYENGISLPRSEFLQVLSIKYRINPNWILTGQGGMLNEASEQSPLEYALNEAIASQIDPKLATIEERLALIEERLGGKDPADGSHTAEPEPEYGDSDDVPERIPYVDDIAAGPPIPQSEDAGLFARVPRSYVRDGRDNYYAARIRGESMAAAGIPDGSAVLIRRADAPRDGAIQVVAWQGRSTLKRLREQEGGGWELHYEDGTNRVIVVDSSECRVQGDFVAVLPPECRIG